MSESSINSLTVSRMVSSSSAVFPIPKEVSIRSTKGDSARASKREFKREARNLLTEARIAGLSGPSSRTHAMNLYHRSMRAASLAHEMGSERQAVRLYKVASRELQELLQPKSRYF